MTQLDWAFETQNAKRLSPRQVAESFVVPGQYRELAGADHCYVVGPRGSGKTTLLKMLQGESLMAWRNSRARRYREEIGYSSVFLPADELWASQTTPANARAAFTAQLLYAFVDAVIYRTREVDRNGNRVHLPARITPDAQASLAKEFSDGWRLNVPAFTFLGIQSALDLFLTEISNDTAMEDHYFFSANPLSLLSFAARSFNRAADQPHHRWAVLLDEMELAPGDLHRELAAYVRGGPEVLVLKISMSPFDRYMQTFGGDGGPIPGHDFRTIYLASQTRSEMYEFTTGLWSAALEARGLPSVSLRDALGSSAIERHLGSTPQTSELHARVLAEASESDAEFARWLVRRDVDVAQIQDMSYTHRSATVRKIYPLIVFRNAVMSFEDGKSEGRSRKKTTEPFTGADAIVSELEGNPRWIKTAFADMLDYLDTDSMTVQRGFQWDAIHNLANRFEALLRVLPRRPGSRSTTNFMQLADQIAIYFHRANTGRFSPDPQNCFIVDRKTPPEVLDELVLGLYAGAIVHVRDRRSPPVLSDFYGQRFRLAYLLAVRDNKEFPLRLGKDVALSKIVGQRPIVRRRPTEPTLFEDGEL